MKKLVIRVYVEGKVKKFTAPRFVSWDTFRQTMALQKLFDSNAPNEALIPQCYPIICSIFGHQFTVEQLERGYSVEEILKKTGEALHYVFATADLSFKGEVLPFERRFAKRK
ncbi:hypothetical protein [Planococcus sp. ISL-110]|uniref:phage tail assembly chaperone G n=1 Tax=Planococcus sp. ISL-110 TaxID=2819167 RepID=UPI001BE701EA|nr:hypothetical protein [Planococcus sp. ISL-110]MBT2569842.1 hypothetical protein [Planococcus sp. ISL-110]